MTVDSRRPGKNTPPNMPNPIKASHKISFGYVDHSNISMKDARLKREKKREDYLKRKLAKMNGV